MASLDEDEMLRLALEESLQISAQQQRAHDAEVQREADLLRQSEEQEQQLAWQRARQERMQREQEEETLRRIMRESERVEAERLRSLRDKLQQMDKLFGSRSGPGLAPVDEPSMAAPAPSASATGDVPRSRRRRRRDTTATPQPAAQPTVRPRPRDNPSNPRPPQPQPQPTQQDRPRRRLETRTAHPFGAPIPDITIGVDNTDSEPTALEDPGHYSLADVLALSIRDASNAVAQEEGFNRTELEAAIAASAEQNRDEEQEAIDRNINMGIPTYEEACAAPMYRAPRGARYTFQGPCKVEGEDGKVMEVVGEMDLTEALRVANRNVTRKKRRVG